jgi:BirA family transcriptional regulator, biotin operon repressor / biotin---[acetyl-CoA-carboxylase] ligase
VRKAWLRHAERLGEAIEVRLPNESLRGVFRDLDPQGYLLLELDGGAVRRISSGDVFAVE